LGEDLVRFALWSLREWTLKSVGKFHER